MNCEKNDLCVVVAEDPECACNIGATLRVVELRCPEGIGPVWRFVEESRPMKLMCSALPGHAVWSDQSVSNWIADRYLVPIRDPRVGTPAERFDTLTLEPV